ncbi:MRP-L47-domain-containing protein [Nemania sp. NC0429]|nr:MRP-L47-domain-containing protein [Nemania sp. NC0429]
MATPAPLRSSITGLVKANKIFRGANTALGGVLSPASSQRCAFSSTPEYSNRQPRRDNNRFRGLSSIYRSGTRFRMNIDKSEIPKPAKYKPKVQVDPNHGLWAFFYAKDKLVLTPDESAEHGRGWTVEELRKKNWDDLHKLWWVCVKEQNRLITAQKERERLKFLDGDEQADTRLGEVRKTMRSIKHTLVERWYLWEDARQLAETDAEIDLSNTRTPFVPQEYLEHETADEGTSQGQPTEQTPPGFMAEEPRAITSSPKDDGLSTPPPTTR